MDDEKFEVLWQKNRKSLLSEDREWQQLQQSYKVSSGADMLLFGIPAVAGIVSFNYVPLVRAEFQRHDRDTGSSEVQIAQLTKEIQALTEHLKQNKKDHSSRYGLLRKVNNRRSLLDYLKREDEAKYKELIKKLGLRR